MNENYNRERTEEGAGNNMPVFYNTKQVADCVGCSIATARKLFYRADFPALKIGKNLKVEKTAFEHWCSERRVDA